MDTDIRDQIEHSFGDGPPTADPGALVVEGRRALRRRRLAESGVLVAVAVVAISAALLTSGGDARSTAPDPAGQPTGTPTTASSPTASAVAPQSRPDVVLIEDRSLDVGAPVALREDGVVAIRPGVRVVLTIADPFRRSDTEESVALQYRWRGTTYWHVEYLSDSSGGSATQPVLDSMTFRAWIRAQRPIQGSSSDVAPEPGGDWPGRTDLELVRFAGDGERLAALDGATITEQRAHPDLPDSWATSGDRSAVAEVRYDDRRWYVLARALADGSDPQFIVVSAGKGGDSLDEFLVLCQERYAEGGGGLL